MAQIKAIRNRYPDNKNYGVNRIFLAFSRTMAIKILEIAQKSENLFKCDFTAAKPFQKWLTDISVIPCSDGKLYIAPVLDCYNGETVGLAMADHMRKELCIEAFEPACKAFSARGMILHSDRGSSITVRLSVVNLNNMARFKA